MAAVAWLSPVALRAPEIARGQKGVKYRLGKNQMERES
jgi:hypothetical protein